jgi:hypothetical protein
MITKTSTIAATSRTVFSVDGNAEAEAVAVD